MPLKHVRGSPTSGLFPSVIPQSQVTETPFYLLLRRNLVELISTPLFLPPSFQICFEAVPGCNHCILHCFSDISCPDLLEGLTGLPALTLFQLSVSSQCTTKMLLRVLSYVALSVHRGCLPTSLPLPLWSHLPLSCLPP